MKLISLRELRIGMLVQCMKAFEKQTYGYAPYAQEQAAEGDIVLIVPTAYSNTDIPGMDSYGIVTTSKLADGTYGKKYINSNDKYEKVYSLLDEADKAKWRAEQREAAKTNIRGIVDRGRNDNIQVGSDPEMFVVDAKGVVIPAFLFCPAEPAKKEFKVYGGNPGIEKPYYDGFQAEFNINPTSCHAAVTDALKRGLTNLHALAVKHDPKAKLSFASVLDIPYEMMSKTSDKNVGLGCAPSTNVYPDVTRLDIEDPRSLPFRFAGCHIHYGLQDSIKKNKDLLMRGVKSMDRIVGPIMVAMLAGIEDTRRRRFYGKAGEYRLPPHGIEYRVPASTVLCHPIVMNITFDMCRYALNFALKGHEDVWEMPGGDQQAQHILNDYNVPEARRILMRNEKILDQMIKICYSIAPDSIDTPKELSEKKFQKIKSIILDGCRNHFDHINVEKNWHIGAKDEWKSHGNSPDATVVQMVVK